MNNRGFAPVIGIVILGILVLAFAAYTLLPQFKNRENKGNSTPPPAASVLTARQQRMVKYKEEIKQKLNINDAQFNALVLMASDSDFNSLPE